MNRNWYIYPLFLRQWLTWEPKQLPSSCSWRICLWTKCKISEGKSKTNSTSKLYYLYRTHAVTQVWARNKSLRGASQEIPWLKGVVDPSTSHFNFSITGLFITTFKKQKYNYSCYNFPWKMKCYVLLAPIMSLSLFYKRVISKWRGLTSPLSKYWSLKKVCGEVEGAGIKSELNYLGVLTMLYDLTFSCVNPETQFSIPQSSSGSGWLNHVEYFMMQYKQNANILIYKENTAKGWLQSLINGIA